MQVSRKRPRLWRMSFSARFTSRPATRGAAYAQPGPIVNHDRSRQVRCDFDATVQQPFADLHAVLCQPALLQDPHGAGAAVISFDEFEWYKHSKRNHFFDDLDFYLFAEIAQLMLRIAQTASDVHAALFGQAVALLIDADDFGLDAAVRL